MSPNPAQPCPAQLSPGDHLQGRIIGMKSLQSKMGDKGKRSHRRAGAGVGAEARPGLSLDLGPTPAKDLHLYLT